MLMDHNGDGLVRADWARSMSRSWNMNIFSTPKFTVTCGNCSATFRQRPAIDYYRRCIVICPCCHRANDTGLSMGMG